MTPMIPIIPTTRINPLILICSALVAASAVAADGTGPILQIESGGHRAQCSALIFSQDGRNLISAGNDKVVRVWDVRDPVRPRLERSIRLQIGDGAEGMIYAAALAPHPQADAMRLLAVAGYTRENEVRLIDFDRGQVLGLLKGHTNVIHDLAFSADGRQLASASSDGTVRVWDLEALDRRPAGSNPSDNADPGSSVRRNIEKTVSCNVLRGHTGAVFAVTFVGGVLEEQRRGARVEPVAPFLLASGGEDGLIRLWRREQPGGWQSEPASVLRGHKAPVSSLVAAPDGRRLASSSLDRTVRVWNMPTGEPAGTLTTLSGDGAAAAELAMSPDGDRLLAAASRRRGGCRIVRVPDGTEQAAFVDADNTVTAAAFSPDGRVVATAGLGGFAIGLHDAGTGALHSRIQGGGQTVWAVGFSADGQRLAFGTRWSGGEATRVWQARPPLEHVFDLATMRPAQPSSDAADQPGADNASGVPAETWQRAKLESGGLTADSEDGKSLLVKRGNQIVTQIRLDHADDELRCFSFVTPAADDSPPTRIAIGSDYELGLYDAASGRKLQRLVGHLGTIWCLAVSPDGRWLASGSADQTIRMWNLQSEAVEQHPALSFFVTQDGQWVVWTPEGYYKASLGGHELIGWHVNQGADRAARFVNAWQMRRLYERPGIVERVPAAGSVRRAIEQYNADPHRRRETLTDVRDQLAAQLPPQITILAPPPQTVVRSTSVRLEAEIHAPGNAAPETRVFVRVMVNGRPVPDWEDRPLTVASPKPKPAADDEAAGRNIEHDRRPGLQRIAVDVPLVLGENTISVFARTESASGEAVAVAVTSQPDQPRKIKSDLYVLAIGVSDYQDPLVGDLEFADDDATALVQALQAQEGRLFGKVHPTTLVNSQATKRDILKAVEALVRQVTQIDLVVVTVSGHGDRDLADRYFFIPHDFEYDQLLATAVRWSDFQDPLSRLPCPVVLIMDTCHSAGVTGRDPTARERSLRQDSQERAIAELANIEAGLLVLSSALPAEKATERRSWGHGAFVLAVLEAIQSRYLFDKVKDTPLPADSNGDGIVELAEVRDYVVRRVKELTNGKQHALSQPKALPKVPIAVVDLGQASE